MAQLAQRYTKSEMYLKKLPLFLVFGRLARTTGILVQEGLDVIEIESVIAAFADTVGFERPDLTPKSYRIRMNVQ
jgi:hypothetical protein